MHFLPDVYVTCDVCKGKRYNRETLEVKFKDKSVADVLDMTVEEGAEFFKAVPSIRDKLETLARVGLGYIHIGQQATTLSGGEAQRIKLAKELSRRATGRTLYILDEPTTGLHFHDVAKLLGGAARAGRRRQHGGGDRAQPGGHQDRRLGDRHGAGGRRRRRPHRGGGHAGGRGQGEGELYGAVSARAAGAAQCDGGASGRRRSSTSGGPCYIQPMTKLEQIQSSIEKLSAREIAELRDWLDELDARLFDEKIERDAKAGKLDKLADEARANLKAGRGEEF